MPRVLFSAPPEHWPLWRPHLLAAFAAEGLDVALTDDPAGPWTFDYVIYRPGVPVADFTPFTRLRAVLSLWAGVEAIVSDPTLTVPLCRMVDAGLTRARELAGHRPVVVCGSLYLVGEARARLLGLRSDPIVAL